MEILTEFWDKKAKLVFISAVIAMVVTHGFCFANLMYTHDSLAFWDLSVNEKVSAGRWVVPFFLRARRLAAPWEMGVFSTLFIAMAAVLVTKILEFGELQGVCVAIALSTSIPLTALLATYIHDADADCMGILLACIAVYAFKYFPKVINVIVSIAALVLCLGIYQAHVSVAIGLFVMLVLYQTKNIKNWKDVLHSFVTGVKEVVLLLVSFVLYMIYMKKMTVHYGVEISKEYNSPGKLENLNLHTILGEIPKAYEYFKNDFLKIRPYNTANMVKVYIFLLVVLLISVIAYLWINRPFWGSLLVAVPCVLVMPLALNTIYLVASEVTHTLMIYAFRLAILLPMIFANMISEKGRTIQKRIPHYIKGGVSVATAFAIFFISFNNVVYANGAYLLKKLIYDNTMMHTQTMWEDVNSLEGYVDGQTEVVFMGSFEYSKALYYSSVGEDYIYNKLLGFSYSPLTYDRTVKSFFRAVLGRNMIVSNDVYPYAQNEEYLDMPAYPTEGYCKMIDGRAVVKLNATAKESEE